MRRVELAYGEGTIPLMVPEGTVVIEPIAPPALADPEGHLRRLVRPLAETFRGARSVAIAFPDNTRPMPNPLVLGVVLDELKAVGLGISTSVGIGGDPINGSSFLDHLVLFDKDPETEAVLLIGEIGGPQEAEAAAWIKENFSKPVIGFVAGMTAPKGRRMGHAGAIISATGDSAAEKTEIMKSYGLTIVANPAEFGSTVAQVLKRG